MRGLSIRMGLAFILVALVPLGIALTLSYFSSQQVLNREVHSRLLVIADSKSRRIEGYIGGLKREMEALASNPTMIAILQTGPGQVKVSSTDSVKSLSRSLDYEDLFIISANGMVVASANKVLKEGHLVSEGLTAASGLGEVVRLVEQEQAQGAREVLISRFLAYGDEGHYESFIGVPVLSGQDFIGFVVAQVNTSRLFSLIHERTGLGRTGSVSVIRTFNGRPDSLIYDAKTGWLAAHSIPAKYLNNGPASRGRPEELDFDSEAGVHRVGAVRAVPALNWMLLVAIDRDEAFASARALGLAGLFIFGITTLVVILVSLLLGRAILVPILRLSETTRTIAQGNFEERAVVSGDDEIARLGRDFNHMIDLITEYRTQVDVSLSEQMDLGTDLQDANDQLRVTLDQAESANRAKSEFLANMSHEIRTPLNGVLGLADLLIGDDPTEKDLKRLLLIKKCGKSLLEILNDILDVSKLEAGRIELRPEAVNVRELANFVVESFSFPADEKSLDLKLIVEDRVPDTVWIDPVRMRQILFNLIGNAVKFTSRGSVRVEVTCEMGCLVFKVVDTGIGISVLAQRSVFERFSQVSPMGNELYGGAGLGLAICKQLTDLMDGEIALESQPGKGSSFQVSIPLDDTGDDVRASA